MHLNLPTIHQSLSSIHSTKLQDPTSGLQMKEFRQQIGLLAVEIQGIQGLHARKIRNQAGILWNDPAMIHLKKIR